MPTDDIKDPGATSGTGTDNNPPGSDAPDAAPAHETPDAPDQVGQPAQEDQTGNQDRPEQPEQPDAAAQAVQAAPTDRHEQAEEAGHVDSIDQPSQSDRPDRQDRPEDAAPADETALAEGAAQPDQAELPGRPDPADRPPSPEPTAPAGLLADPPAPQDHPNTPQETAQAAQAAQAALADQPAAEAGPAPSEPPTPPQEAEKPPRADRSASDDASGKGGQDAAPPTAKHTVEISPPPKPSGPQQPTRHQYNWNTGRDSGLPYLILDIGANPAGKEELARAMVKAAAAAGAPAVKFQAYAVKDFIHPRNRVYNEMLVGEMPYGLIEDMAKLAHDLGMQCGVTVFSPEGIDRALACKADFIKIASGDINYLALIREAANAGPPLILSTGASTSKDVRRVLGLLNSMEKKPAAILQCTSLYPAPATSCYLAVMAEWLGQGLPAGFSDHSMGVSGPLFAYALGAVTVEKHFTTDRTLPGGDNFMSLLPEQVAIITSGAKSVMPPGGGPLLEAAARESLYYGQRIKRIFHGEDRRAVRRVACAARRLPKGTALRTHNLKFLRLGTEIEGRFLGPGSPYKDARLLRDVELLEPIAEDMVEPAPGAGGGRKNPPPPPAS